MISKQNNMQEEYSKFKISNELVNNEMEVKASKYAMVMAWAGIFIYPFWGVLDYFFADKLWLHFFASRIFESLIILFLIILNKKKKIKIKSSFLYYVIFLGMSLQIAIMCNFVSDKSLLTYFLGFAALYIACNLLVLWHPKHSLIILLVTLFVYFTFYIIFHNTKIRSVIEDGGLLFITVAMAATLLSRQRYFMTIREIKAQMIEKISREETAKAYEKLTDSIRYAQRIQEAILPANQQLNSILKEYFVVYIPKETVSGDFYWISDFLLFEKSKKIVVAAVDCTGHGVPGAFMSMIGSTYLNLVVNIKGITQPNEILETLDKYIRITLKQDQKSNKIQDGMDIALTTIDWENKKILFAGAHNPLIIIKNNEIIEFKGTLRSIGGHASSATKNFDLNEISFANEELTFYMFSDGYADQIGGEKRRKFMKSRLKELLLTISKQSMQNQFQLIRENFFSWMNKESQIDDILVIGIKI